MRPVLRLKAKLDGKRAGDARLLRRVAWIYNNEVENYKELRDQRAFVVDVRNAEGKEFGVALFNPNVPLRKPVMAKMIAENVHVEFTPAFFRERILRALALREAAFSAPYFRLINAEGDELPGVTVDQFGGAGEAILVVQFHLPAWEEEFQPHFLQALEDVLQPKGILLKREGKERQSEFLPQLPAESVKGAYTMESPLTVQETDTYDATLSWDYSLRTLRTHWAGISKSYSSRVVGGSNAWCADNGSEAVLVDMPRLSATAQTPEKTADLFKQKVLDAIDDSTKLLCVVCRDYSIPDLTLLNICRSALPCSAFSFEAEPGMDFPTPLSIPKLRPWRALGFTKH